MGLPSVLALACLLASIVFVLLATTLGSHGLVNRIEQKTRARLLAEAVLKRCCLKLRENPNFGLQPEDALTVTLPGNPAAAAAELRFDGPMASCNNLAGNEARPSAGGASVPGHCALLIGIGRSNSQVSRVEVLLRRAEFPYVLASQGPVVSVGATRVGALPDTGQSQLLPGDLASNSGLEQAVELGPDSFVSGDLRAVGGVVLAPQATVAGQTLAHSSQIQLPRIDLRSFDPLQTRRDYQTMPVLLGDQSLAGVCRCSTNMTVQGHLELQGASLFVDGDLAVSRGISGAGLLVVMGRAQIAQGIQLEGDQAVLLSHGAVSLTGTGKNASQFHGLVYTEGGFQAQQVSLTGTFIASGSDSATRIEDSLLVYDPAVTRLELGADGSVLVPGSPGKDTPKGPVRYSTRSPRGAWVSASSVDGSAAQRVLFNLNDFLSEGQPMETVSWREDP